MVVSATYKVMTVILTITLTFSTWNKYWGHRLVPTLWKVTTIKSRLNKINISSIKYERKWNILFNIFKLSNLHLFPEWQDTWVQSRKHIYLTHIFYFNILIKFFKTTVGIWQSVIALCSASKHFLEILLCIFKVHNIAVCYGTSNVNGVNILCTKPWNTLHTYHLI